MNWKSFIGTALIGVAAYAGFTFSHKEATPLRRTAGETLNVTVTSPKERTVVERVSATGTLVPREDVAVTAQVANVRILRLSADVGDRVSKGQALALLDAETLLLQVAQMEADHAKARDEFARIESIKDTGAVSKSVWTEKKSALDAAKAKLDEARLNTRRAAVTAPEDGIVIERRAAVGGLTGAADALFRIAKGAELEAELRVPETYAGRVAPRQTVTLSIPGDTAPLEGTVRLVAPRVDAADRSTPVRVTLPPDRSWPFGTFVHASIALREVTAPALPSTAIRRDGEGAYVWTVDDANRVVRQAVSPLIQWNEMTLVDGAAPELRVVARAGSLVRSGDTVTPVEAR